MKTIKRVLLIFLCAGLLAACGSNGQSSDSDAKGTDEKEQAELTGKLYHGLGSVPVFRVGPGKDSQDVQVYSFNYVTASVVFDEEGKIVDAYVDTLEVSTPNYDGASMPHFSGWPGKEGYNVTDHDSGEVVGVSENTEESIAEEVNNWVSKRERGDDYGMNYDNDWYKQMNFYQKFFKGKTVDEIEAWFEKFTSDKNGRPLKADSDDPADQAKYNKLTDEEKAELAEVVSGATMSLKDGHGDILGALRKAYENRVEIQ